MTATTFPINIEDVLVAKLASLTVGDAAAPVTVQTKQIDPTDANGTISVEAGTWKPVAQEIGVPEPMGKYSITISTLVKNATSEQARRDSAVLAKSVRVMLYRDQDLAVQLANLTESLLGYTERVTQKKVFDQRFMDGKVGTSFAFITVMQFDVYTEIV